jgi:beta-mannosidase
VQAPPSVEVLGKFIPEHELWPPGRSWKYHGAQLKKLNRYIKCMHPQKNIEGFVECTQRAQAYALQIAIEHFRRRKYKCSGVIFWQFNEPWYSISWSVVDYALNPKRAYYTVKRVYNPLLVALDYEFKNYLSAGVDEFRADVWILNDYHTEFSRCALRCTLEHADGTILRRYSRIINVPADACESVGKLKWHLPSTRHKHEKGIYAKTVLSKNGKVLSENVYDLTYYDPVEASPLQRLIQYIAARYMG